MANRRALLTDREREIIAGKADVTDDIDIKQLAEYAVALSV